MGGIGAGHALIYAFVNFYQILGDPEDVHDNTEHTHKTQT